MKRFKPVGGGYLQRCGQAVNASSPSELLGAPGLLHTPSLLAKNLNRQVLWGHMTVSNAARIAADAVKDGLLHNDLRQLAKSGSAGKTSHTWRDYKRYHPTPPLAKAMWKIRIETKTSVVVDWNEVALMYPHKLFATLHGSHPKSFAKHFLGGSSETLAAFWDEMHDHPAYAGHPMHQHQLGTFREWAVPLKICGDGTPTTGVGKAWAKQVDAIIASSLLGGVGRTWYNNFILTFLHEVLMAVDENGVHVTEEALWKELCWSLYWLYEGVHPDRGSDNRLYTERDGEAFLIKGTPLAGGFYGVVWSIAADPDSAYDTAWLITMHRSNLVRVAVRTTLMRLGLLV